MAAIVADRNRAQNHMARARIILGSAERLSVARVARVGRPAVWRFRSVVDLQAAINRYLAEHNHDPKPFTWTATPAQILAKLNPPNAPVH